MEPLILDSARDHGVADEDMLHAIARHIRVFTIGEDESALTMFIGPDRAMNFLEVGVADGRDYDGPVIVHAMRCQAKYLR